MELPNYFFVDLPGQAGLSPELVLEACRNLKRNRLRYLEERTTESIINLLAGIAADWLEEDYHLRRYALEEGPKATGFSRQIIARGLNEFFSKVTPQNLQTLVTQDLGQPRRLDEFVSTELEVRHERASMVRGPELIVQMSGGTSPDQTFTKMILGLLARSSQFVALRAGTSFFLRLFGHSIYLRDSKLASCLEMAEWSSGNELLENALIKEANCLTITGTDEEILKVRAALPAHVRFLDCRNKVSFAFVTREMLTRLNMKRLLQGIAADISAWDQQGSLSPEVIYVETGGTSSPVEFCEVLAQELALRETAEPRGTLSAEAEAAISMRHMFYGVRAADQEKTRIWRSENSTAWTIVYEEEPQFQRSCLNRFIYVKPVASPEHLMRLLAPLEGEISTVGLSASMDRAQSIAVQLAKCGATRVCPTGRMTTPPLTWRHLGRPSLADFVTWTDFELP